jgi:hypothetical protein
VAADGRAVWQEQCDRATAEAVIDHQRGIGVDALDESPVAPFAQLPLREGTGGDGMAADEDPRQQADVAGHGESLS